MARPKEFDRDEVVKKAIAVFRDKGYAATSTDDLLQAMNIGRQSMYDTFGDKRRLYLEALQRYNADGVGEFIHSMSKSSSPLAGLESALLSFAAKSSAEDAFGCMGVSAVCEFGQSDADVVTLTETSHMTLAASLERQLRDAKAKGEIPRSIDERAATQFINSTLLGMKLSARGGASHQTLKNIASFAIKSLKAP
jgi:AcrR family transcriptional regulator